MKHIDSINELFGIGEPKEGDEFVAKLLDIVEQERIKIIPHGIYEYIFTVDQVKYYFNIKCNDAGWCKYYLSYKSVDKSSPPKMEYDYKVRISSKLYNRVKLLYKEYEKRERIANLPDISDVGRSAKKYNL